MERVWRIDLLGTLKATHDGREVTRFRTRRVASLLAYLAYFGTRIHSRDEVSEMLWPDTESSIARKNLRQALSSLRMALEPAPMPAGTVVLSIYDGIQLNPKTLSTDVAEFEDLISRSKKESDPHRTIAFLKAAIELYKGDLLPGFTDEWIWAQRLRLEDLYLSSLRKLSSVEPADDAINYLRLGLIREPFNEHWHQELLRRYLETDRPERALDQYAELEKTLAESFGQRPSVESRHLAEMARKALPGRTHRPEMVIGKPLIGEPVRRINLPVFANRYFGRSEEIQRICEILEGGASRLVTILGPAGVGKTRISVQCARMIADRQDWHIWFVPLAERFNAAELYETILASIDFRQGSSSSETNRISELTGGRRTLLVLDNLEQIADDVGTYVAALLNKIPHIMCLGSSRQPLQIQAEQVFPIEPLPLPLAESRDLASLAEIPSVQLFIDRCQSIRPDLQLNDRNASAIVELCARLEGLPLAIEIAAGLSNSFSPVQMARELPLNITGIMSRKKDVPARHKSLRAAIDWSFDVLSGELRQLFRQLCVFRGGFTLRAATEVCLGTSNSMEYGLTALQSIQERSLIRSQPADEGQPARFSLLVAFREYAEEHLQPQELLELRERHADFFVRQIPPNRPFNSTDEQTAQHLAVELDYDNFTAAIEFSLSTGNLERSVKLLGILSTRWLARGPKTTERRLIRDISNREELNWLSPELRVQALRMLGTTYIRSGEYQAAYEAVSRAVEIASTDGDSVLLATSLSGLSVCAGYLGRLEECLELNRKVLKLGGTDNLSLAERSHLGMGSALWNLGKVDEAAIAFERARGVSERLRGGEPDALIVINQARVALDLGRGGEALRLAYEAIRISRRLRDDFTLAVALTVVSRYHSLNDNIEAAVATNLEALEKCKQGDFLFWILLCLRTQALLWTQMGRFVEAAILLAATSETEANERNLDSKDSQDSVDKIRSALSPQEFERAWARGLAMDRTEAIQFVSEHSQRT